MCPNHNSCVMKLVAHGSKLPHVQVFRKYDTNRNGTLELQELVQLCRQEFPGLSHSDICFMQVRKQGHQLFECTIFLVSAVAHLGRFGGA
eukprot:1161325-Pelagomonas_calceolata.AAC.26